MTRASRSEHPPPARPLSAAAPSDAPEPVWPRPALLRACAPAGSRGRERTRTPPLTRLRRRVDICTWGAGWLLRVPEASGVVEEETARVCTRPAPGHSVLGTRGPGTPVRGFAFHHKKVGSMRTEDLRGAVETGQRRVASSRAAEYLTPGWDVLTPAGARPRPAQPRQWSAHLGATAVTRRGASEGGSARSSRGPTAHTPRAALAAGLTRAGLVFGQQPAPAPPGGPRGRRRHLRAPEPAPGPGVTQQPAPRRGV